MFGCRDQLLFCQQLQRLQRRCDCCRLIGAIGVGCPALLCGDADGTDMISISDAVYLINYIFSSGPAPDPVAVGDADCSGAVSISDVVYLINYIFAGGPAPCATCAKEER